MEPNSHHYKSVCAYGNFVTRQLTVWFEDDIIFLRSFYRTYTFTLPSFVLFDFNLNDGLLQYLSEYLSGFIYQVIVWLVLAKHAVTTQVNKSRESNGASQIRVKSFMCDMKTENYSFISKNFGQEHPHVSGKKKKDCFFTCVHQWIGLAN